MNKNHFVLSVMSNRLLNFQSECSKNIYRYKPRRITKNENTNIKSSVKDNWSSLSDICRYCNGWKIVKCPDCNYSGRMYFDGFKEIICTSCHGTGLILCPICCGRGKSCLIF
jgi:hypothetical protein